MRRCHPDLAPNNSDETVRTGASAGTDRSAHPARIDSYRIVRVLGQGGMGLVYEAEQLQPFRRTVALKVIRRGMDTSEVLARFESERQSLAVMDHPNIAKALDAGTTEDGLPYFVMELVAGVPITEYCDAERLDLRRRLELFAAVCKGVQHAHQKGVIHRDLKPSNILVRVTDGKPVPTIIDFGIAKAVEGRGAEGGFATQVGMMVGTPAYMSPEQAEASELDIDTRSDIYSLGMVLYEMVTGVLPFEMGAMMPAAYIYKYVLGNAEVPTPSRRVSGLAADTATSAAQQRHTTPVGLGRDLRGDLDWIVLKAIQRDRNRRYDTANALALDIERHLEHKPVVARPPTLAYTASRFVRRHRLGVAVAVTAAVGLAVMIAGIARERTRAELASAKAQAISAFLGDMLRSADPWEGGAREITVVEALRAGVARVNAGNVPDPAVAASVKRTIGSVYLRLGRIPEADTLLRAALAERLRLTGAESEESAESFSDLGMLYLAQGKLDSAETTTELALAIRRRLFGARDTMVASSLIDLSDVTSDLGQRGRSDSLTREALEIYRAVYGERSQSAAASMGRLASIAFSGGDLARTDSIARSALTMLGDIGQERTATGLGIRNDLALSRSYQGDHAEALALMHQVVALDSALFGPSHPMLATHLENLGLVYDAAGFRDSNSAVLQQVLRMRRAVLADDNPAIGRTLFNLAVAQFVRGEHAAAEPLYREALDRMRRAYGPEHIDVVWATASLGRNEYRLGRLAEAERNLRWALEVDTPDGKLLPPDFARMAAAMVSLLMDQRRWAEAEPLALRVLAIRDSMRDTLARSAAAQVAELYRGWGKPERAAEYSRAR